MPVNIGTLEGLIRLKDSFTGPLDKAASHLGAVDSQLQRTGARFDAFGARVTSALTGLAIVAGVTKAIHTVYENVAQAEEAMAQLEAGVRSTGGAAGLSAEQIAEMAGQMQRLTAVEDETIMQAQGVLLTFTKIGREAFPEATMAALNLSRKFKTDLSSAAMQVGKALNDPVKGVTALSKAGVQFTESQKATIKSLVETGKVAEAQRVILAELETQVGGAAAAFRDTLPGAIEALKNSWGDLLEEVGQSSDGGGLFRTGIEGMVSTLDWLKDNWYVLESAVFTVLGNISSKVAQVAEFVARQWLKFAQVAQSMQNLNPDFLPGASRLQERADDEVRRATELNRRLKGLAEDLRVGFAEKADAALEAGIAPAKGLDAALKGVAKTTGETSEEAKKLAEEARKLAKELAKVATDLKRSFGQSKELTAGFNAGASRDQIAAIQRAHKLHNAYLQDVEKFGKAGAEALKGLRAADHDAAVEAEKAKKVWEARLKVAEEFKAAVGTISVAFADRFERTVTEGLDGLVDKLERARDLTTAVATDEERRLAALQEAKGLLDQGLITQETYRRILQENATWIATGTTEWEKHIRLVEHVTGEIQGWAGILSNMFEGVDDDIADLISAIGDVASAWEAAAKAQTTGQAAMAGAQMGQAVFGAGQAAGFWQGNRGKGEFGGQLSGDYADIGAQVGGVIGAIVGSILPGIGTAIGAVVGSLIGGIIGGAIKKGADEGLAKLQAIGGEISVAIQRSEGGLGKVVGGIGDAINDAVTGVLNALGAELQSIGDNVWIKVRDDIITVTVGNVKKRFKEMEDALSFAITEILKQADISGLSETMRTIIENTAAEDVEGLLSDIEFGQWYERLGFEQIVGAIRDALIAFRANMKRAADLGLDVAPIMADFARNMQRMRDQLLGIQVDPEEQLRRDIDAWNAEMKLMDAEQAIREADLTIRRSEIQARVTLLQAAGNISEAELSLRMSMLDAEYQIVGGYGALLDGLLQSLAAIDEALATVRGIRDGLAGMGITDEEREEALRRLRAQRGGGGTDPRQGVRDFIDNRTFELGTRAMSDYRRELAELTRQYDDLLEQAGRDNVLRQRLIELREREIELMRAEAVRDAVAAFQDFLGLVSPFEQVRDTAADLIAQINDSPFGNERKARMIARVLAEVERQLDQLAQETAAGLLGSMLSDLQAFGATEQQMFDIRKSIAIIEHNLRMAHYAAQIAILKAEGRIAPEIIRQMEAAFDFLAGIDPALLIADGIVRTLSPREYREAVERDKAMVNGANGANELADALKRAKDLLAKYQTDGLDPLTRNLRKINEDFALIRKAMGSTPEVMSAYNAAVRGAIADFLGPIKDLQRSLVMGDLSPVDTLGQWDMIQKDFADVQRRFRAGDLSVVSEVPSIVQELLGIAREISPVGSEGYKAIFTEANRFLNEVLQLTPEAVGTAGNPMAVAGMGDLAVLSEAQVDRLDRIHVSSERVADAVEGLRRDQRIRGALASVA